MVPVISGLRIDALYRLAGNDGDAHDWNGYFEPMASS